MYRVRRFRKIFIIWFFQILRLDANVLNNQTGKSEKR